MNTLVDRLEKALKRFTAKIERASASSYDLWRRAVDMEDFVVFGF
jgi:hypothetical protein